MVRKLFIAVMLLLGSVVVGFPLGSFGEFCIVLGVCIFLLNIAKTRDLKRYGYGVGLLLFGGMFLLCLPNLEIEEGHNLFLKSETKDPFLNEIPEAVYADFEFRFLTAYPIENQCREGVNWCWKTRGIPNQVFAFSSDSFFSKTPKYSRVVDGIHFSSLSDLKTGFINDYDSCFYDDISDVKRNALPYFVKWDVNEQMVGGKLEWSGNVWIGSHDGGFENFVGKHLQRQFSKGDVGKEIWASRIAPVEQLSVAFQPSFPWIFLVWSKKLIAFAIILAALATISVKVRFNLFYEGSIAVAAICVLVFMNPEFVFGHPALWGGGDGLWTEGFSFWMTQALAERDLMEFWRGGENAYYLMPYLRYIRTVEDLVFGDSNFLMVLITVCLPILMYRLLTSFTSRKFAFYITLGFLFFPWHFGFSRWAELSMFGLSETVAFVFLMPALLFLTAKVQQNYGRFLFVSFVSAIAIGLRPNYLPVAFLLLIFNSILFFKISPNRYSKVLGCVVLFSIIVLLIPLHNFVFTGRWVPFTTGYHQVKTIEWFDWILAVKDCLILRFDSTSVLGVVEQLNRWLFADPKIFHKLGDMPFVRQIIVVTNPIVVFACVLIPFFKFLDPRVRLIAVLAVVAQGITLLFNPTGRYSFLGWDLCWMSIILFFLSFIPNKKIIDESAESYLFSLK